MSSDAKSAETVAAAADDGPPLFKAPPGELSLRYPTICDLRKRARRRVPRFAFDYVDGAAGAGETGMARNAAALDAVELVPRYGIENFKADMEVELFGRPLRRPHSRRPHGSAGDGLARRRRDFCPRRTGRPHSVHARQLGCCNR